MNRILTGAIALLVTCGFLIWWFQPSQVLKRRTTSIMETLTLAEGAGAASRNMKVYPLSRALADRIEISGTGDDRAAGEFPRADIESGFSWLTRHAKFTRMELRSIESITVTGNRAVVLADVDAHVVIEQRTPLQGRHRVTLHWEKYDDGWKITRAAWQPR